MSFRDLTPDQTLLRDFRAAIPQSARAKALGAGDDLPLHVFEWSENQLHGTEISDIRSVGELSSRNRVSARVIFAPRDIPRPDTVEGFVELFQQCRIPNAFVSESLQGVSQSFGECHDANGTVSVWFHILCKDLAMDQSGIIQPPGETHSEEATRRVAREQRNADFTWLKPGFVLRMRDPSIRRPQRSSSSTSDITLAASSTQAEVELFCFGAPSTLRDRFQKLIIETTDEELLQNPYLLLDIVLEEMFKVLDRTSWVVGDIFGSIETQTLAMASTPGKATKELPSDHFTGLHNLAKHTIYLRENCEAAMTTLEELRESHRKNVGSPPSHAQELTRQALRYRRTLFQSTQRRLTSLDARMANIIQLSFHIVTQGDSRLMQTENQSMKTIAVMTLIFMPLGTIAGIFGTQFMKLQDDKPYHITVSRDFWLLWIIAVPLTAIVLTVWRVWYMDARGRLIDELPRRPNGEPGYMGWKSLGSRKTSSSEKA